MRCACFCKWRNEPSTIAAATDKFCRRLIATGHHCTSGLPLDVSALSFANLVRGRDFIVGVRSAVGQSSLQAAIRNTDGAIFLF